jgi:hypothetical protein
LFGKAEGKKPLGRPRPLRVDNIKIYLRETEYGDMDWTDLAQDIEESMALTNTVINLRAA